MPQLRRRTLIAGLLAAPAIARAQAFPSRPLSLVVPFAPGGAADVVARIIAQRVSPVLGQAVVVENRAGAGGAIATEYVTRATPDGHTLLWAHSGTLAVNPWLYPRLGYNPETDFAYVALVARVPMVLVVPPSLGVRTLGEFVAMARARPDQIDYGSAGHGSNTHIAMVAFAEAAGIRLTHVPYRGSGPVMADLVAGVVKATLTGTPAALPLVRDGQLLALAVTSARRLDLLPEVPTMAESGLAGFEQVQSHGIVAPVRTPPEVVGRLNRDINAAIVSPEVVERLASEGAVGDPRSPEGFRMLMAEERAYFGALVRRTGLKLE